MPKLREMLDLLRGEVATPDAHVHPYLIVEVLDHIAARLEQLESTAGVDSSWAKTGPEVGP